MRECVSVICYLACNIYKIIISHVINIIIIYVYLISHISYAYKINFKNLSYIVDHLPTTVGIGGGSS